MFYDPPGFERVTVGGLFSGKARPTPIGGLSKLSPAARIDAFERALEAVGFMGPATRGRTPTRQAPKQEPKLRRIVGYASVFGKLYRNPRGQTECIACYAFDDFLSGCNIVPAMYDHTMNLAPARLWTDSHGLLCSTLINEATPLGGEVVRGIRSGRIGGMSFLRIADATDFINRGDAVSRHLSVAVGEVSFVDRGANPCCVAILRDEPPAHCPELRGPELTAEERHLREASFRRLLALAAGAAAPR